MRRKLLIATTALTLCAVLPARAFDIVHDPASNATRIVEAARAISEAIRQYQMLERTYNAVAHATDLQGLAQALGPVTRTYMPEAGSALESMRGVGQLWGQAQRLRTGNRIYMPPVLDEWANEMERRENATANAQAIAAAGMEDAQDRISRLSAMQLRLETAQDGTEVAAVNGQILVEQQNLAAHRAQIEQAHLVLAAEDRVAQQRSEQRWRRDVDDWAAKTEGALAGW
ncbi:MULTISPECIES: type IV secretion system protein [Roseicella]|uniref:Type IV secretion system protein n=1 Tax=Roseicella aquatilis TaxID=2527868 RepID=A0A4R4D6H6_9PROT|nr:MULTISPECIES: type IV secretion system protein [Roseicella]NOG73588.1 hypothetical protein [Roseicella sp. DB1501]TCZ55792.1 hypothetical protein EXY23_20910 [Roseicella aquatilis]